MTSVVLVAAAVLASACGGSSNETSDPVAQVPEEGGLQQRIADARRVTRADFEPVDGRTVKELAGVYGATDGAAALATSVFTRGRGRLAFGMIDQDAQFVWGRSAVYVAPRGGGPATGPFVAPADELMPDPAFRSKQAASEVDPFAAIYAAEVPFRRTGVYDILTVTRTPDAEAAATGQIRDVGRKADTIPDVGDRAPLVETDTLRTAGGVVSRIDTREPPSDMHQDSFADVVGRKPVALLFATPQLCQSRVCGPVVDVALQLRERYGDRVEFIHQEVYVDNDPAKGVRAPLAAFRLPSEPWLFVVGKDGRITARLEGSFGLQAFEDALKTAL